MTRDEILLKLRGLYKITGQDWSLSFSMSLTEPTAPVCAIRPDGSNITRCTVWGDTIDDAITKAVDLVYQEVIEGKRITPESPITNPDDHKEPPPWQPK